MAKAAAPAAAPDVRRSVIRENELEPSKRGAVMLLTEGFLCVGRAVTYCSLKSILAK